MPEVFADTGYYIALLNKRDSLNTRAENSAVSLQDAPIVTTEMVLTELLNHASMGDNEKRRLTAEAVLAMAQDLVKSGAELPALMTAGRWKNSKMPARYTEKQSADRGAVARYCQESGG